MKVVLQIIDSAQMGNVLSVPHDSQWRVSADLAMTATVKDRRLKELEILKGLAEGEKLTIGELNKRLNQTAGYGDVTVQTVRSDIARDKRFEEPQVKAKLSIKELDVEVVKARRDQEFGILKGLAEGEKLTIGELVERLNQAAGYEDVRGQMVRDDIAFDKRFEEPQVKAKLSVKEWDVATVKARRDQELEILKGLAEGEKLTIGELAERLNQAAGYEDVTVKTVRDDIALDKRLRSRKQRRS